MLTFPSGVSRTLDPTNKSLVTIVGLHDHQLSDADVNLIQTLQDQKRQRLLNDQVTSGCLTYTPFQFNTNIENTFVIPSFDVLFNGEVVTITGQQSANTSINRVQIPSPPYWIPGMVDEDSRLYIVFLELWYQSLDPESGTGYYTDVNGTRYFYPYGCVNPSPSNLTSVPDDSVDIMDGGLYTTQRAQIQWRLNVQRVALTYDFTKLQFGLDPGSTHSEGPNEIVYAQGSSQTLTTMGDPSYQFTNMGGINGDTGIWRAGTGDAASSSLGTMDGYSYAMPVAVVFQRNTGPFDVASNPFGCANPLVPGSGILQSSTSGRYDWKLADQIFHDDVIDTRQCVSLEGWDYNKLVRDGFSDLIIGKTRTAISRGESPGMSPSAVGSTLGYYVSMAPTSTQNVDRVGAWDGFSNGFSSDQRTYYSTQKVTVNQKSVGQLGAKWGMNDSFTITLPVSSNASIQSIVVQALVTGSNNVKSPVTLLSGQLLISGLGSHAVTVTFATNLVGTQFDPGANSLYVTIGVQYPAASGVDLRHVPISIDGGVLYDGASRRTLPIFGISEYALQHTFPALQALNVVAVNPEYSNVNQGTRIWLTISGSQGIVQTGSNGSRLVKFIIDRTNAGNGLNNRINGFYAIKAWDLATGTVYSITDRLMNGTSSIVTISDDTNSITSTSTVVLSFLAQDTAQVVYNAPVCGIVGIEETVLFGTYLGDAGYPMDSRVDIVSVSYNSVTDVSTVILGGNNCLIKGISGDDTNKFVWVVDNLGNLSATSIPAPSFNNGLVVATVPGVDLTSNRFLFCGAILPALDPRSKLTLIERYIPYQGEGALYRDYEVLHTEDNALITTNGTGAAPVPGLKDVYPYNRELPITVSLPAQASWQDETLANTPLAIFFDSNYEAMRVNNVEHTFLAPLHTNDFIQPMNKDIKKAVRFITSGGARGFSQAIPHVGFAIRPPVPRVTLGENLQATTAPIMLYVNNAIGDDNNDGLTPATPKQSITAALDTLPPVLRHPCSVQLVDTGVAYSINNLKSTLQTVALGDGGLRSARYYALANLAFSIQQSGRLVISREDGATNQIVIDATGFTGFGDGPTSAFFVDNTRVIFNGLKFTGFTDPAVKGIDSDIDFVDCAFAGNLQAGSFEEGCGVILSAGNYNGAPGCSITLPDGGVGMVIAQSSLTASNFSLTASGQRPGAFFVGERSSSINLETHNNTIQETNVTNKSVIVEAQLNSSIVVAGDVLSNGMAVISANSTLSITTNPFNGGIVSDASSEVVTTVTQ